MLQRTLGAEQMIRFLRKAGRFLLYGGFGGPKPYEVRVFAATAAALNASDAEALKVQIAQIERLQRWNEDRMVLIGFESKDAVPKLQAKAPNHCLAKLRLKGSFGSIPLAVMTHEGVLSSLEFRKSPRGTTGDYAVEVTEINGADPGVAASIDEEEHGAAT